MVERLLLSEFRHFVDRRETFALESTLSGKTYARMLADAKRCGFRIYLHYLWLPTVELALARVRERVKKGGHNVPDADVGRRFERSRIHLFEDYEPLADRTLLRLSRAPFLRSRRYRFWCGKLLR